MLSHQPGDNRPASVDLLLAGVPSDEIVVPKELGSLEAKRVHGLFVAADVSLIELARAGASAGGGGVGVWNRTASLLLWRVNAGVSTLCVRTD
jgi:hypothetical protein